MTTRLSFNANALRLGDAAYFQSTVTALQPTSLTIMDGLDTARAAHGWLGGKSRIIHRSFNESEANVIGPKYILPADLVQRWVNQNYGPIYAYGPNEPGPSKATLDYLIEVGDRAHAANIHCCLGNIGPATWQPEMIKAGLFDDYLRMLDRHRGWHVGGWHTYMTALPPWGAAGRDFRQTVDPAKVQPAFWPTAEEVRTAQMPPASNVNWLTMRTQWFDLRVAELGMQPLEWELTECFLDYMPNLEQQFPDVMATLTAHNGGKKPDKLDIRDLLAWWFPQWSYEQTLFEMLKWCDAVHPKNYHGFTMFTWSTSPDWAKSNFIPLRDLHQRMIAYSANTNPPPTSPPPVVVPPPSTTADIVPTIIAPSGDFANVRSSPTTIGSQVVFELRQPVACQLDTAHIPNIDPSTDPALFWRKWVSALWPTAVYTRSDVTVFKPTAVVITNVVPPSVFDNALAIKTAAGGIIANADSILSLKP